MGLKLAVSGKGGVGKTTLAALLARSFAARGKPVIAIDADPVPNLSAALGIPPESRPEPIASLGELIAERTGTTPGRFGGIFKMNPTVDDLPEKLSVVRDGVRLLVMGTVERGGSGCVCPESVLLRALVQHLLLRRDDTVILDMEAGVEHLGRATSSDVDRLLIVVDPGLRSIEAARRIRVLADDLKLRTSVVANRVRGPDDRARIEAALADLDVLAWLPFDEACLSADRDGIRAYDDLATVPGELTRLVDLLEKLRRAP